MVKNVNTPLFTCLVSSFVMEKLCLSFYANSRVKREYLIMFLIISCIISRSVQLSLGLDMFLRLEQVTYIYLDRRILQVRLTETR